jgi:hypothetical protein
MYACAHTDVQAKFLATYFEFNIRILQVLHPAGVLVFMAQVRLAFGIGEPEFLRVGSAGLSSRGSEVDVVLSINLLSRQISPQNKIISQI